VPILSSRGCNGHCLFCASQKMMPMQIRSADNVMKEIQYYRQKFDTSIFTFLDDNFSINIDRTVQLCNRLSQEGNIRWTCQVRGDIDTDLLDLIVRSGTFLVGIGVESGVDEVLRKIVKNVTLAQIEKTARISSELGAHVACCYVLGHYCDTPSSMQKTLDHAQGMKDKYGAIVKIFCNTPFPGTPQYINRNKLGLKIHARNWDEYSAKKPIVSSNSFTLDDLQEAYYAAGDMIASPQSWEM